METASIQFLIKADFLRRHGELKEAEAICRKGLLRSPDLTAGRFLLAQICYLLQQYQESRKLLLLVLKDRFDHGGALRLMCRLLIDLKEFSRAREIARIGLLFHAQDSTMKDLAEYCDPLKSSLYLEELEKWLSALQKKENS